jgi:nucleotide-binding universal stress UspA family protein
MSYRSIVVGTDGSATAQAAVLHAAGLAKAFGASLRVVSAFHPHKADDIAKLQQGVPDDLAWVVTDSGQAEDLARAGVKAAQEAGARDVRTRVEAGDPAEVLISIADEVGADLIVVGSKGMTSATRFVLGNVPNKVSHHAPCDLVIVHTAG